MALPTSLRRFLSLSTAPFLEQAVFAELEQACQRLRSVTLRYDRYGNLLVHYRRGNVGRRRPLAFVAHTDHPGFAALEMLDKRTLRAAFRGGVRVEYFKGARVRFDGVDGSVKGSVLKVSETSPPGGPGRPPMPREVHVRVSRPVAAGTLGMWDRPRPKLQSDRVVAPACDDLAGVAAIVEMLGRLSRKQASANVYALFTRAEEVGFVGAVGAIRAKTLPKRAAVVSIETSSALVNAPIGDGPILRVGDRGTIYTPRLTAFCVRVAQKLAGRRKAFAFQRKLMDGGMCEAAAFGSFGYDVTGICLALGNYHNMDTKRQRIASEWVSLKDWKAMVDLFEALVLDADGPGKVDSTLRDRIGKLFKEQQRLLREAK